MVLQICVLYWATFCPDVTFTSDGGESLHTTGLCFGRLVTMSLSVLSRGLRVSHFEILCWV